VSDAPSKARGGRRPGAGRPPTGAAKSIVQERVPPDLAQHCKAAQAATPGYLARLIERDLKESNMSITEKNIDALKNEAGEAGDVAMVKICDAALEGDSAAWGECARVISANRYED